jgi:hypothetical protein
MLMINNHFVRFKLLGNFLKTKKKMCSLFSWQHAISYLFFTTIFNEVESTLFGILQFSTCFCKCSSTSMILMASDSEYDHILVLIIAEFPSCYFGVFLTDFFFFQ